MAINQGFAFSGDAPHDAAEEATALAAQLRSARLTVAYGAPGAGRQVFAVGASVMPLLRRRADDRPAAADSSPAGSATVISFPERRRSHAMRGMARAELALRFDAWRGDALVDLKDAVYAAAGVPEGERLPAGTRLAVQLARLQQRLGVRFLIVLDRFEEVLRGAVEPDDLKRMREIAEQVFEAADRLLLAANFLLCVSDDAEPWFAKVRNPIEGFDDRVVRLPLTSPPAQVKSPPAAPLPAAASAPSVLKPDFAARAAAPRNAAPAPAARVAGAAPLDGAEPARAPRTRTTSPPPPATDSAASEPLPAATTATLLPALAPAPATAIPTVSAPAASTLLERALERLAASAGAKPNSAPAAEPATPLPGPAPAPVQPTGGGAVALQPAATATVARPAEPPALPEVPVSAQPARPPLALPNEPPSGRSAERPQELASFPAAQAPMPPAPPLTPQLSVPPRPEVPALAAPRAASMKAADTPPVRVRPPESVAVPRLTETLPMLVSPSPDPVRQRHPSAAEPAALEAPSSSRIESAMSFVRGAATRGGAAKPASTERAAPAATALPPIGTMRLTSVRSAAAPAAFAVLPMPAPVPVPAVLSEAPVPMAPLPAVTADATSPLLELAPVPFEMSGPAQAPLPVSAAAAHRAAPHPPPWAWAAGAAVLVAGGAAWFHSIGASNEVPNDPARPSARSAQAPSPRAAALPALAPSAGPTPAVATPPLPAPAAPIVAEAETRVDADEPDEAMARELTRGLAAAGVPVAVGAAGDGADLLAPAAPATSAEPRFAIARYDALQAARGRARDTLQIVTPLYTEEMFFLVRADSPLQFIHQIEGRTVNVGAPGGGRALTVDSLYERMFGARPAAGQHNALPLAAAVTSLLGKSGVDVIALVGGQPLGALSGLPGDRARQLRLLKFDGGDAESRRALRSFLPATVPAHALGAAGDAATPTLSVMSFLVATGAGAGEASATGRVAQALCDVLPRLKREGHAKWREVQTSLTLPAGWPYALAARQALDACRSPGAGPLAASAASRTALAASTGTLR